MVSTNVSNPLLWGRFKMADSKNPQCPQLQKEKQRKTFIISGERTNRTNREQNKIETAGSNKETGNTYNGAGYATSHFVSTRSVPS